MNANHPLFREELAAIAALPLPWERLRGRSVAVTGGTGLIGASMLRGLQAANEIRRLGMRIIALCRRPERMDIPGVEAMKYDALEDVPEFDADYILHAASNAHPLAFASDPVGTLRAGLLGTMGLLEKLRERGGRLLL